MSPPCVLDQGVAVVVSQPQEGTNLPSLMHKQSITWTSHILLALDDREVNE